MVKKIDILESGVWANIEAEVKEIWNNEHPAIRQVGILKDSSGIIKFVSWEVSDKPLLQEGETYSFEGMPVTSYEDRLSVAIVKTTVITRISPKRDDSEIPTV